MTRQPTEQLRTAPSTATTDCRPPITTYRRLRTLGFDEGEAANLIACLSGIAIGPQAWTIRELSHLLFLREMHHVGRRWSDADDRAAIGDGPGADLDRLAPPVHRSADALGDHDREGG